MASSPACGVHVAVDLGAGSGRVVAGTFGTDTTDLVERYRFTTPSIHAGGHLRWSLAAIEEQVDRGLALAGGAGPVRSVGVDGWGVDYAVLDAGGRPLADPISYRDSRTQGVPDRVFARVPRRDLFRETGIQVLPFNTLFQWVAQQEAGGWTPAARRVLLLPDYLAHRLGARACAEYTNATTTQMVDVRTRDWHRPLLETLALPASLLPEIVPPGTVHGHLTQARRDWPGLRDALVVSPATHDTASAVAGTPLREGVAFVSSGTWSLVGVERDTPALDAAAFAANLTNEGGVEGRYRVLKNVMGLWLLERCRQEWSEQRGADDLEALIVAAGALPHTPGLIDPDGDGLFNPASMLQAIIERTHVLDAAPLTASHVVTRVVLDSLALRYAQVIDLLEVVTGTPIESVRIVGGGSRNNYLNQATASATGRVVMAGPAEASVLGNLAVQAIALGRFANLAEARAHIDATVPVQRFEPKDPATWRQLRARFDELAPLASRR